MTVNYFSKGRIKKIDKFLKNRILNIVKSIFYFSRIDFLEVS